MIHATIASILWVYGDPYIFKINTGGYFNGTDRYTAPFAGVYTFNLALTTTSTGYTTALQSCTVGIFAFIYDAGNVVQSNNQFGNLTAL